jgi:putative chitinase
MYVSADRLKQLFPSTSVSVLNAIIERLSETLGQYQITTLQRVSMFLAQVGQESNGFSVWEENLNYSAQGLLQTFPSHFSPALAAAYARQPQRIANRVYADRLGNGPESSGDGWKYRGRGAIQITGKANYAAFGASRNLDADGALALLSNQHGGLDAAGWFWDNHSLNALADTGNVMAVTKVINGGTNGLAQRTAYYNKALGIFATD